MVYEEVYEKVMELDLKPKDEGLRALVMCASAGVEMALAGEVWSADEAIKTYALMRRISEAEVRASIAELLIRSGVLDGWPEAAIYNIGESAAASIAERRRAIGENGVSIKP